MSSSIAFATSNKHKVALFQKHADPFGLEIIQANVPLVEPQADSVEAVVLSKALQAFRLLGVPVVVEDTGFSIDALRGFPGPYTKYVLETVGARGILNLAQPLISRHCGFINAMVCINERGENQPFIDDSGRGQLAVEMDETPCEDALSDLWRIFIPDGAEKTLSALTAGERNSIWSKWQAQSVYTRCAQWIAGQAMAH